MSSGLDEWTPGDKYSPEEIALFVQTEDALEQGAGRGKLQGRPNERVVPQAVQQMALLVASQKSPEEVVAAGYREIALAMNTDSQTVREVLFRQHSGLMDFATRRVEAEKKLAEAAAEAATIAHADNPILAEMEEERYSGEDFQRHLDDVEEKEIYDLAADLAELEDVDFEGLSPEEKEEYKERALDREVDKAESRADNWGN